MSVIERIAKLHAKAESAREIGQHAEAGAFDAKVRELLGREGVTLEDVMADIETDEVAPRMVQPVEYGHEAQSKPAHPWLLFLASGIAGDHGCAVFWFGRHNGVGFVGRPKDRDAAIALFCQLVPRLEEMARRELEREETNATWTVSGNSSATMMTGFYYVGWGSSRDERWRISWLCGAAHAVGEKLARRRRDQVAESDGRTLVRIGHRRDLQDWIEEAQRETSDAAEGDEAAPTIDPLDVRRDAFEEGARAAWALNLRLFELPEEASA